MNVKVKHNKAGVTWVDYNDIRDKHGFRFRLLNRIIENAEKQIVLLVDTNQSIEKNCGPGILEGLRHIGIEPAAVQIPADPQSFCGLQVNFWTKNNIEYLICLELKDQLFTEEIFKSLAGCDIALGISQTEPLTNQFGLVHTDLIQLLNTCFTEYVYDSTICTRVKSNFDISRYIGKLLMKWVYKIAYGLLFAVTVLAAAGSLYYYSRVNDNKNEETAYEFRNFPDYYFSMILNTKDDIYWKDFKDGATDAAKRFNIALEFNEVSEPDSQTSIVEYIHIASQSKMDGIIVAEKSSDEYNAAIKEATESGINVVVGNYDESGRDRVAYVGTNKYEYGVDAAELIAKLQTSDSQIDLAIIWSEEYRDETKIDPVTQNIMDGISKGPINLKSTLYGTSELLGAEDQIRNTLNEHPDIDVILCTNAKDTVSAANVIRERNLVGKVFIVGTDVTEQIIDYLKRGVIFGVLDRNGYSAGYQSVRMLSESMGTTFSINNFRDVNINTYTTDNIWKYSKP